MTRGSWWEPGRYEQEQGLPFRHDPLPNWGQRAGCIGHDPMLWISTTSSRHGNAEAEAICATCPVQEECLEWAMENDEQGLWAGRTRGERRSLRHHPSRQPPVVD